ncbi:MULTISPECIES: hypothetical protein [Proteiniphilum]|jgi:hypothetical protein|uniref:hypothetical protein n=2 Tax=Dysgonomonadaceae TaxID=2005520 RepID=UPI001EEC165A|nr:MULTISPECIES: hypothetical protein [Proteiniphilum]ULB33831.1 hypothetical protein KDN43_12670 [Proteiniphilum propionicum]
MMRFYFRTHILLFINVLLISCSGGNGAKKYLSDAAIAYQEGNYSLAKLKIDSIKMLYPKSFDEINAGFSLMQQIRMSENIRNIVFCDSMLRESYDSLNEMLTKFDYVRDGRYQEFGEYYPKSYPYHSSLNRNGLRSGVREKGVFFIESIVLGSGIKHNKIRVTSRDGSFAETLAVTSDGLNYRFNTIDRNYEIVRYSGTDENGVAQFIYTFQDEPLTVHIIGNRTINVTLSNASKKGISQSFELSRLLLNIEQLKLEKEKSEALIKYLESRKQ